VALKLAGDPPLPAASGAHLGLARLHYAWNDLAAAEEHAQQSLHLARQLEHTDRFIASEVMLARLRLARGEVAAAWAQLAATEQAAQRPHLARMLPEITRRRRWTVLLQPGQAGRGGAPGARPTISRFVRCACSWRRATRVAALALLASLRAAAEAKGWQDELLQVTVLQALAHQAQGERRTALRRLEEALALAEPGGFIRLFVDEGAPMAEVAAALRLRGA
jgi:LuxR family maltose regulon positive regulatory protein